MSVGKLDQFSQMLPPVAYDFMFHDETEEQPYFEDTKANLARYLKVQRFDLFLKEITQNPDLSLEDAFIPKLFPYQNTLVEFCVDFLGTALFLKKDEDVLYNIVKNLISRQEYSSDKEQEKLITLIGTKLSFDEGMELLLPMFNKRKADSEKVLEHTVSHGNIPLLDSVLAAYSDEKVVESVSMKTIHNLITSSLNDKKIEEHQIQAMKSLLGKLLKISNDLIDKLFSFNNPELLDKLCEKDFDTGYALRKAVSVFEEPRLIERAKYTFIVNLLAKNPSAEDVDMAIASALNNFKEFFLQKLLQSKPDNTPETDKVLREILASTYGGNHFFEHCITVNNLPVVKLFLDGGKYVQNYQFRIALSGRHQDMLNHMIESENLDLHAAMGESIEFRNLESIKAILKKRKDFSSHIYMSAIKTKNKEIITLLKEALPLDQDPSQVMKGYDVEEIFKLDDRIMIEGLVDSGFSLGHCLYYAVKTLIEPRLAHYTNSKVDFYWYELVDKILAKNPSVDDFVKAIKHARVNSKTTILFTLVENKPEAIDRFLGTYEGDDIFAQAIEYKKLQIVKLFLDRGQVVSLLHKCSAPQGSEMRQLLNL